MKVVAQPAEDWSSVKNFGTAKCRHRSSMRPSSVLPLEGEGGWWSAGDDRAFCEQDSRPAVLMWHHVVNACGTALLISSRTELLSWNTRVWSSSVDTLCPCRVNKGWWGWGSAVELVRAGRLLRWCKWERGWTHEGLGVWHLLLIYLTHQSLVP